MIRIAPLALDQLPEPTRQSLRYAEQLMGFIPNDALIMARWPELLAAIQRVVEVVYKPASLDPGLKRLIATVVSGASGCRYCQAHTAHGANRMVGVDHEKLEALSEFATSPLFSAAERAALNLALAAGQSPNAATDTHFAQLRQHFTEPAILEIVGMIALFGFLNRWNDTLATPLEAAPLAFGRDHLQTQGWQPGKHAPAAP